MKLRLLVVLFVAMSVLSAAPITGLSNTGASTTGSADNFWTLVAPPGAGQVVSPVSVPELWLPNTGDSSWEWSSTSGQPVGTPQNPVTYTFRHLINLGNTFDVSSVVISGRWATDNVGTQILVNGHSLAQTSPGYDSWSAFTLTTNFVAGLNIIDFVVEDYGVIGGFRVEFLSAEANLLNPPPPIPEPITWALMGTGLVGLGIAKRRQKT